ncbi:MAG TPA: response regulator [Verrucomicrobiae bacterium]|nr:response regulator [Verrucomicrobiae bacterium]
MKKTILVADDDTSIRSSLQKVLQEAGYRVLLAADGRQTADCLNQQSADLLILDLNLPAPGGFELLDLTREQHPSMSVLVLTGLLAQCEPGALAGADFLIEKPPDVAMLLQEVELLLNESEEQRAHRRTAQASRANAVSTATNPSARLFSIGTRFSSGIVSAAAADQAQ